MSIFDPFIVFLILWILSTLCVIYSSIALEWKVLWLHFHRKREYNIRYRWGLLKEHLLMSFGCGFIFGALLWIPIYPLWFLVHWIMGEFLLKLTESLI